MARFELALNGLSTRPLYQLGYMRELVMTFSVYVVSYLSGAGGIEATSMSCLR